MKSWKLVFATAVTVVMLSVAARAEGNDDNNGCSNATLKGPYSISTHGEAIGFFVGTTLTRFPFATLVDAVQITTFDGTGNLTAIDFIVRNGVPVVGATTMPNGFRTGETGTYSVAPDCTGTIVLNTPDGAVITLKFVLANNGHEVRAVFASQHVAQIPNNPDCAPPTGCNLAVNIQSNGVRVKGTD
jgi:hypothetical protein